MAIDTTNEKLALMEWDNVFEPGLPTPSGDATIDQADQQQFLWGYPGILWTTSAIGAGTANTIDIMTLLRWL